MSLIVPIISNATLNPILARPITACCLDAQETLYLLSHNVYFVADLAMVVEDPPSFIRNNRYLTESLQNFAEEFGQLPHDPRLTQPFNTGGCSPKLANHLLRALLRELQSENPGYRPRTVDLGQPSQLAVALLQNWDDMPSALWEELADELDKSGLYPKMPLGKIFVHEPSIR